MSRTDLARFEPATFEDLHKFAGVVARSSVVPKMYAGRPDDVLVAFQMGAELGLRPLQALQNIAVINGRPAVWGDAMLAICAAHPDFVDIREEATDDAATCTVKRRGRSDVVRSFSKLDAQRAKLLEKEGPWQTYPRRMLQMRARAFALRDMFPDALRGIASAEEARDIPPEIDITDRAEVLRAAEQHITRDVHTRTEAALRALGTPTGAPAPEPPPAPIAAPAPAGVADEAAAPPSAGAQQTPPHPDEAPAAAPAPEPAPAPRVPLPSPSVVKAAKSAIDRCETVDAVNDVLDGLREWPAGHAKKAVSEWAHQRIGELTGRPE